MTEVLQIRDAAVADLRQIINLLRDDPLGQSRESGDVEVYYKAFARMSEAVGNVYMLATFGEQIVGCLQFTIIHGLSRAGAARAQIEGVRVHREHRGAGIGEALMVAAIGRARAEGCTLVQLTTDKSRERAHAFYEKLGFIPSHTGMKLALR